MSPTENLPPLTSTDVDRVLEQVLAAPARAGATRVLAVDGPSGSGKTTLSRALLERAEPPKSDIHALTVVHLEDFYPGWNGLAAVIPRLVEWVLRPLARGEPPAYRRYDWQQEQYAEWHPVEPAPVVVIEGVGAGALLADPYLSVLVYLDAPEPLRYRRAMARDGEGFRPHWDRWAAQESQYFRTNRPRERAGYRFAAPT